MDTVARAESAPVGPRQRFRSIGIREWYSLRNKSAKVQSLGRDTLVVDHFDYAATNGKADAASTLDVFVQGSNDAPIVVKPLADREVRPGKAFCWQIPRGSFLDIDAGDALAYSATLADGSALPAWLKFDAATLGFTGVAPKKDAVLDIRITATDRVAATGNTVGSLSAADVFRLEVDGGCNDHGNEGVGNGEDPPPPGHDHNWNDGPGTWPGHPGSSHGNGRDDRDHDDRHDDGDKDHGRDKGRNYFDPSVLAAYCDSDDRQHDTGSCGSRDEAQTFARWLEAEQAVSRLASEANRGVACLDTARGADIGGLGRATGGLHGGRQSRGDDTISLLPGAGLKGFTGLQEGLRHLG